MSLLADYTRDPVTLEKSLSASGKYKRVIQQTEAGWKVQKPHKQTVFSQIISKINLEDYPVSERLFATLTVFHAIFPPPRVC